MRLKIQTCICSPNLVILLPGKYDCSEQSGSQSFGSAIVSSTDTCLQKSKPNPTFQGTPVCHSAIRERLLQLGDTMKAAGGWHLEDRFQSWVHKQPWRQMLPLDGFECFACMNPKQIYLNVWFLPSQFRGIYIYIQLIEVLHAQAAGSWRANDSDLCHATPWNFGKFVQQRQHPSAWFQKGT